jgi:hypothetical protein
MKLSPFIHRHVVFSWLALALLVNCAIAGTTVPCSNQCTRRNCGSPGDSGQPCVIKVSQTNGSHPVATVNKPSICVDPDTDIVWYTSEHNSSFTVTFAMAHPFANTPAGVFKGSKGHPSGDTLSSQTSACYQYSVQHCVSGSACAQVDPKVIVNGVGFRPPPEAVKK